MISQMVSPGAEEEAFSGNFKAALQSLFRFQDDIIPQKWSDIDVTLINFINYKKILEIVKHIKSVIKSQVISIEVPKVKESLLVIRVALDRIEYHINLVDSRMEHLNEFLETQSTWKRHIPWTRNSDSFHRFQKLQENKKKLKKIWNLLNNANKDLQHSLRHIAMAILKSTMAKEDTYYLSDVEALEDSRESLCNLLREIEIQTDKAEDNQKIVYYESDHSQIYSVLEQGSLVLEKLPFLLSKLHLDSSFLFPELTEKIFFRIKPGFRWYLSDKYVFRQLTKREAPLRILINDLDRLLQPESQKINGYLENIVGYSSLIGEAVIKADLQKKQPEKTKPVKIKPEIRKLEKPKSQKQKPELIHSSKTVNSEVNYQDNINLTSPPPSNEISELKFEDNEEVFEEPILTLGIDEIEDQTSS